MRMDIDNNKWNVLQMGKYEIVFHLSHHHHHYHSQVMHDYYYYF
jgi:hypothetical protein